MKQKNAHRHKPTKAVVAIIVVCTPFFLWACNFGKQDASPSSALKVHGGIDGIANVEMVMQKSGSTRQIRSAALLGVFVSQYLSQAIKFPVHSALTGIVAQQAIAAPASSSDPDYQLLQRFQDTLNISITDLLNRSTDRDKALNDYVQSLNDTAKIANDRYQILTVTLQTLDTARRDQQNQVSTVQQDMNKATAAKNFTLAGEDQAKLTELTKTLSDTQTKYNQTKLVTDNLNTLLTAYGTRILAIQKNRELLLSGLKAVDIPGADINIIERDTTTIRPSGSNNNSGLFNNFFDFTTGLEGL